MIDLDAFEDLPLVARIIIIALLVVLAHLIVRAARAASDRMLAPPDTPEASTKRAVARRYPKIATIMSLTVSALMFAIYFAAVGLIMVQLRVDLTAYFATATVVGLAVGFGSQSLVQDVLTGLTLIFTDAMDIGDVIEVPGQVGRVQEIGLRFTQLVNFKGQRIFVPNRNIAIISRYRGGAMRAYVDVQIPAAAEDQVTDLVERIARGMRSQHPAIIISDPEVFGVREAESGGWRYVRVKFRIWPGQEPLIQETYRQRVLAAMKELDPDFAAWMVDITWRVE
jgi:small conductance mechanosensitive channel